MADKGYFAHEAIPFTVTEEKLFGFLFFQSQRSNRKRGRKRGENVPLFNLEEFTLVMNSLNEEEENTGQDVINQYYSAILKILYGRVMRHKEANLCPIGAIGLISFIKISLKF